MWSGQLYCDQDRDAQDSIHCAVEDSALRAFSSPEDNSCLGSGGFCQAMTRSSLLYYCEGLDMPHLCVSDLLATELS